MNPNTLAVWKNVETRLDIPFRKNMVDLVLEMARDHTADPHKIATWMVTTSTCICYAIFRTDDPMPLLSLYIQALDTQYPDVMSQIAQIYDYGQVREYVPVIASHDDLIGLLCAAGSTFANGELILIDDEIDISPKGLEQLNSIWKTPVINCDNPKDNPGHSVKS